LYLNIIKNMNDISRLMPSEEIRIFINELPIIKCLKNTQKTHNNLFFASDWNMSCLASEVYRRIGDLYDVFCEARLFLCLCQKTNFPEIYSEPIPAWGNYHIRATFLNSAIEAYNSAFDFLAQIIYLSFKLYEDDNKNFSDLSFESILTKYRNPKDITSQEAIVGEKIVNEINKFCKTKEFIEVHYLCNSIKHRKRIRYSELPNSEEVLIIRYNRYNSHKTLLKRNMADVIQSLKDYHHSLSYLCEIVIEECKKQF